MKWMNWTRDRRGGVLVFCALAMVVLLAMGGLVVDGGNMFLIRQQLQGAVDSAALLGAQKLPGNAALARSAAAFAFAQNVPHGTMMTPSINTTGDAITVTATVNYQPTLLAALGTRQISIGAFATAENRQAVSGTPPPSTVYDPFNTSGVPGIFSKNSIQIQNSLNIDSYDSRLGAYNATTNKGTAGNISTDGSFQFQNSGNVEGHVQAGGSVQMQNSSTVKSMVAGGTVQMQNSATITGNLVTNSTLTTANSSGVNGTVTQNAGVTIPTRTLPPIDFTPAQATNNNAAISSFTSGSPPSISLKNNTTVTIPAGTYYLSSISLQNNSKIILGGKVTLYITGNLAMQNSSQIVNTDPKNLGIYSNGNVSLQNNTQLYAGIYAPNGNLQMQNSAQLFGGFATKQLQIANSSTVHLDVGLFGNVNVASGSGNITSTVTASPAHFGLVE